MSFEKVAVWSYHRFFLGESSLQTKLTTTKEEVEKYINHKEGTGNWKWNLATPQRREVKIKSNKVLIVV